MHSIVRRLVSSIALLVMVAPAVLAQQGEWRGPFSVDAKWEPFLDVEGMVGTKRQIGELDLFVPLGQTARTLLFSDSRFKADGQNSLEGNWGLGARHMLDGGWNAGVYGYYDLRRSPNWYTYNQLTFGAELLGTNFDFRANTYWPIGQTSNVMSTSTPAPTAAVSGTSLLVTFPGTTTTAEYAMTGFDAEAGVRIPIFDMKGPYDLRFYAGGYSFTNGMTPSITGPRLRLEFTTYKIPDLWGGTRMMAGVEWQYDDVRGSQAFASLRLRVPLQGSAQRPALNYQERRMTDPIVRDVDIVSQVQSTTTAQVVEPATATAAGQGLTVINSSSTNGAGLQAAINGAGANSTVVLSGTFVTTSQTNLVSGQTVVGSAPIAVRTSSGRTATVTPAGGATITSSITTSSAAVGMANNSTLAGMTINQSSSVALQTPIGVLASGVSNATIANNTINSTSSTTATAVGVRVLGATNITVSGNSVNATNTGTGAAFGVQLNGGTGNSSATISASTNNRATQIDGNGNVATVLPGSTGNVIVNGGCNSTGTISGAVGFTNGSTCP